ncbi:MAG: HNH endonuclease family protein [Rhodoluna sp.]|nr:HNH endonuclease family protein [Rhodoluna sp.]
MPKIKLMRLLTASSRFFISSATASAVVLGATLLAPISVEAKPIYSATSISALAKLKVRPLGSQSGYDRDYFSDGWGDIGSCDLRNYILNRDLTNITWRADANCLVATGTLKDPYTGKVIRFVRGVKTSMAVQIDHVVALSNAWKTGAASASATTRYNIANDPLNLLAVDGPTNGSKSDSDASQWLPPNRAYHCAYVSRQVAVKVKYKLWVTTAEKTAMTKVLRTCPTFKLPVG